MNAYLVLANNGIKYLKANSFEYKIRQGINPNKIILDYHLSRCTASVKHIHKTIAGAPKDFFKKLSSILKIGILPVLKLFKKWKVVKFFSKIGWSFKKLWGLLKKGRENLKTVSNVIAEYVENTKVVKWTKEQLEKLDDFLKQHPKTRKIVGIGVAAILIYIWFNMSFSGDIGSGGDFDMSDILNSLSGKFSLAKIFASAGGVKLLTLFATGSLLGLTFPWPGPATIKFISAIIGTLLYKVGIKKGIKFKKEKGIPLVLPIK